jgi:hypothetical protein
MTSEPDARHWTQLNSKGWRRGYPIRPRRQGLVRSHARTREATVAVGQGLGVRTNSLRCMYSRRRATRQLCFLSSAVLNLPLRPSDRN